MGAAALRCIAPLAAMNVGLVLAMQTEPAIGELRKQGLECAACRFIWGKLDTDLLEAKRMPPKKRIKKLTPKWSQELLCKATRFGERMGVANRTGKYTSSGGDPGGLDREILYDAFEYARGAGFGHNGNEELQQVAMGTHKDVWVDRRLGKLVIAACNQWYNSDHVEAVIENMEDVLIDGGTLKEQVCGRRLQVCPFEASSEEEL
mmetsp:Transcript_23945/g.55279  ORF Transcript_23945/g.55279 Transcript_23945/m.55279 type:complete len:205 (-) Transcript_23945:49-663(-)